MMPRVAHTSSHKQWTDHCLRQDAGGKIVRKFARVGRAIQLSANPVRKAVRRLVDRGALRLVARSKTGHVVEVRLPEEIRAVRLEAALVGPDGVRASLPRQTGVRRKAGDAEERARTANLEAIDFMQTKALRQAIHSRERGQCFYCLRRLTSTVKCLDHVMPRVQLGSNSYRNLVSCCLECNSRKGERPAEDFLRGLYRERRLTAVELTGRLRALDVLACGKLLPGTRNLSEYPTRSCLAPTRRGGLHLNG